MKTTTMLLSILALVGTLPGAATAQDADPRLPSVQLPADLDQVLRSYEDAWEAGDGRTLARLFTEDGFIRRRSWLRGRDAIRARYDRIAAGDLRLRAVGYHAGETSAHIVGAYGYGDRAAEEDAGVFVLALVRESGGPWLIAADLDHGL